MKKKNNIRGHVKTVAVCAILAVIGFVLDRFVGISIPLFGMTSLMINVSYVPIFMAGILYGPIWGALVGGVQDILCLIIVPLGAPIWGITATTMLAGAMAGFFGRFVLKINASNRGELLVPSSEERKKSKYFYITAALGFLTYTVSLLLSAMKITVGDSLHELSIWNMLTKSTGFKSALLELSTLLESESLNTTGYTPSNLENTFAMVSILFVLALPVAIVAIFLSHKRKNVIAIIAALASFISAGLAAATMALKFPKMFKEMNVNFEFGVITLIAPIVAVVLLIIVLVEADAIKFKIAAFCAITAITTSVLNSFWISLAYANVTFWVYLLPRLSTAVLISTPLYAFLLYYLLVKAKWLKKMV